MNTVLEECNDLCDVSLVDALDKLTDEEVKTFLKMQRQKGRPGSMSSILTRLQDTTTSSGPDTSQQSLSSAETSAVPPAETSAESSVDSSRDGLSGSLSSISIVDDTRKDPNFDAKEKAPSKSKEELIDERIASVLDKCGISGRCAVHLIAAILKKLKINLNDYKISFSTIGKRGTAFREEIYEKVKDTVKIGRGAVVHFDGKLMDAITGNAKVDRLAVKVTYGDVDQLIGDCCD